MPWSGEQAKLTGRCPGPEASGRSRREILRFGLAGLASIGLPDLLQLRASANPGSRSDALADKSIILIWCHGGASHLETYDPKPDAPPEIRGPFTAVETNVAGIRVSNLMPLQAKIADRWTVVRSIHHRGICHQQGLQTLLTGHEELALKQKPDFPDAFCVLGKMRDRTGSLPQNVGIPPLPYGGSAYLGYGYEPFVVSGDPSKPTFEVPDITLSSSAVRDRLHRRVRLMGHLDDVRRDLEHEPEIESRSRHFHAAVDLLTGNKARMAFDLARETPATRESYGMTQWGQSMLLARRLAEHGVGAIVVSLFGVENGLIGNWDDHAVNADCFKAMEQRAPIFDRGVAALIRDLYDRGLDKKVMVVVTGEFGRTPKVNEAGTGRPGRDHWPHAMSVLMAGGGMRTGQAIGATDSRGEFIDERPLSPNDLLASIYHHMEIDPSHELVDRSGRPIPILDRSAPIAELGLPGRSRAAR